MHNNTGKLILIFLIMLLLSACASNRRYPYNKKKKKRDCNCPKWSENIYQTEKTFFYG